MISSSEKIWRPTLIVLFGLFLAAGIYLYIKNHETNTMKAMNCTNVTSEELKSLIKEETARQNYAPGKTEERFKITFHFNIEKAEPEERFFVVESQRMGDSLLYRGIYNSTLVLVAGTDLLKNAGLDNFSFKFFNKKTNEICVQMQDGGAKYWEADADVFIEFLDSREIDKDIERPIGHKVSIRK